MKLEFIAAGAPDRPLLRIFDFQTAEAAGLKALFDSLADGSRTSIGLVKDAMLESINGCELHMHLGAKDLGVTQSSALGFECVLTPDGWLNVAGLAEPFCEHAAPNTYQWLNEDGPISLLLSPSGTW